MIAVKTAHRALWASASMGAALAATAAAPAAETPVGLAFAGSAVDVAQSRDGHNRRVRIHNQTGWTMARFYASDSRAKSWAEDILGGDALASGRSWAVNIDDGSGACVYDFRARFTNGEELIRYRVNVCQIADYYYTR